MLVELLEQYSEKMAEYDEENKVEFKRKGVFDSDDDIDIDNLDLWRTTEVCKISWIHFENLQI